MKQMIGMLAHAADLEQLARLRLDAFRRVEHHHGAVGRGQRAVGVFAEILVAGRVEQVEAAALVFELQRGRGDRDAARSAPSPSSRRWRGAAPLRARTAPAIFDRAAVEQQLLRQRRLAGVRMRNDGEGASPGHFAAERSGGRGRSCSCRKCCHLSLLRTFARDEHSGSASRPPSGSLPTCGEIAAMEETQLGGVAALLRREAGCFLEVVACGVQIAHRFGDGAEVEVERAESR